jgi:hypothetical protein
MKTILGAVLFCLSSTICLAADEQVIQQLSANGSRNTRPFTVKDAWELRWDAKSDLFSASLYTDKGEPVESLASQRKAGPGSTFYPKGGSYFVKITALGDWTISVVQLP